MNPSGWFEEDALVTQILAFDEDGDENGDWTEDDEEDWDEDDWDDDDDDPDEDDEDEDEDWEEWSDDEDDDDDMFGRKRPHRSDWN